MIINKIILKFAIAFCFTISLNAQNVSGKVTYVISKNPANAFSNNLGADSRYKGVQEKIENSMTRFKFVLEFNPENSIFYLQNNLSLDTSEFYTDMSILATRGNSVFYVDRKKETILEEVFFLGQDFLIQSSITDLKWELTKETKKIGKYMCFKATALRENFGPVEEDLRYSKYTAWYCPELAINFGPYEVCGLPGLVLEYTNGRMTYSASEITLSNNKIELKESKKGKVVSRKEFEDIGKKAFENTDVVRD